MVHGNALLGLVVIIPISTITDLEVRFPKPPNAIKKPFKVCENEFLGNLLRGTFSISGSDQRRQDSRVSPSEYPTFLQLAVSRWHLTQQGRLAGGRNKGSR